MRIFQSPGNEDDEERFRRFKANGSNPLQERMMVRLGDSYDDMLLFTVMMALENALRKNTFLNVDEMIERHLEWQEENA